MKPKIPNDRIADLISLVQEKPDHTAEELRLEWQKKYGPKLGRSSMVRALRPAKLSSKKTFRAAERDLEKNQVKSAKTFCLK